MDFKIVLLVSSVYYTLSYYNILFHCQKKILSKEFVEFDVIKNSFLAKKKENNDNNNNNNL